MPLVTISFNCTYSWSISRKRRNAIMKRTNGNTTDSKIVRYAEEDFQMIDVIANGACFYNTISVALAYHNQFLSPAEIKHSILERMLSLHQDRHAMWFKNLFDQYSFSDETRGNDKISLHQYIQKQKRSPAWAGMLEAIICCEVFSIEINTFVRGSPHLQQHMHVLTNTCGLHIAERFTISICCVRTGYLDATTGHNHYVFLRPIDLTLSIHTLADTSFALKRIRILLCTALPTFAVYLQAESSLITSVDELKRQHESDSQSKNRKQNFIDGGKAQLHGPKSKKKSQRDRARQHRLEDSTNEREAR